MSLPSSRRELIRSQYKTWRVVANLSQLQLAEATGISASRYWRIENMYAEPTNAEKRSLARAFGITRKQFDDALSLAAAA